MENHHFEQENSLSNAIFHSYFDITRGYSVVTFEIIVSMDNKKGVLPVKTNDKTHSQGPESPVFMGPKWDPPRVGRWNQQLWELNIPSGNLLRSYSGLMGFDSSLMGFYSDLMGFYSGLMGYKWYIPSGYVKISIENDPMCSGFPMKYMVDLSIVMLPEGSYRTWPSRKFTSFPMK